MDTRSFYENQFTYSELQRFEDYHRNLLLDRVARRYLRPNSCFLDLGCNDGVISEHFQNLGAKVTAIDISEVALARARQRGITNVIQADFCTPLPLDSGSFDMVFWGDNVEHLYDPLFALKEIHRVLKQGGVLILTTPNMGWLGNRVYYLVTGNIRRTEGHPNPPWMWEHIRFFNKSCMRQFLESAEFRVKEFHASDKRRLLNLACRFVPSLAGSIMLMVAEKLTSADPRIESAS